MTLEDLTSALGCEVDVPPALWAAAELLAGARRATNSRRSAFHDRGEAGNKSVDLHGAFGELMLQRLLRAIPDSADAQAYMATSLFASGGGAGLSGQPDLIFNDATAAAIGVDAKTFDCSPRKRFFAIADSKHEDLRGKVAGYFVALAAPYGKRAAFARLIPYSDVDCWPTESLRRDPETREPIGNASRNLPLPTFMANYCPSETRVQALRGRVYAKSEIDQLMVDHKLRTYVLKLIPSLDGFL